jgi:putative RNA 2'-phosphotransferase
MKTSMQVSFEVMAVSKFLSFVLRHRPEKAGLTLDANGFAPIPAVIDAVRDQLRLPDFSVGMLDVVLQTDDKKRYEYDTTGTMIRACQGHSIGVDLALEPQTPPADLYHGTSSQFLESIQKTGLEKRRRDYVHLSTNIDTAIKVGARRGKPAVLVVRALEMRTAGFKFYKSTNDVWLVDAVPPHYLTVHEHQKRD